MPIKTVFLKVFALKECNPILASQRGFGIQKEIFIIFYDLMNISIEVIKIFIRKTFDFMI